MQTLILLMSSARFAAQVELVLFFPVFGLKMGFLSRWILNGLPNDLGLIGDCQPIGAREYGVEVNILGWIGAW